MTCDVCGGKIKLKKGQSYLYAEASLENILLVNINTEVCQSCGDVTPIIPNIIGLHQAISIGLVRQPYPLSGKEIRFLRKERGIKAKDWAEMLGIDPSTLSRWENGEQSIGAQFDRFIRLLYVRIFEEQEDKMFAPQIAKKFHEYENERPSEYCRKVDVTKSYELVAC